MYLRRLNLSHHPAAEMCGKSYFWFFPALQLLPPCQLNSLRDLTECNFQETPPRVPAGLWELVNTQNELSPCGPAAPKRKGKWVWTAPLSNNETAHKPARKRLKLITAQEGWVHMLGYSCLLISLSALTVIPRYIRRTALKRVELVSDVFRWGKWKSRFGFNYRTHGAFPVTLWLFSVFFLFLNLIHYPFIFMKED